MKQIKLLIIAVVTFFSLPSIVLAANDPISLTTPKMASKDEEISVDIVLYSDVAINGFKATFTYESSALELLSIVDKNEWVQSSSFSNQSPLSLDFSNENGVNGSTTVATLKFKVKKDVAKTSTILTVEGTTKIKADETINTLEKVTKTIEIRSTDNTLKDLKVNGETLTNFSPTNYMYSIEVPSNVTTANFEATLNDKTATFKDKYGPKNGASLDYGENTFEIIVISAAKEEKSYVVKITRQDNRGTNNNLSELIINSNKKLLDFKTNTLLYTITTHKLKTIDVTAVAEDPKATIKIDKPEELVIGSNEIKITVTSEKKDEKQYTVIINNSDKEIDTTLSDIELFGCDEDINFDKNNYDYEVTYKSKYKDNSDEAEYDKARLDKDMSNLAPGKKITITVKAKDGTEGVESTYTITFKEDNRINFFLILGLIIFIVLLVIFIKLLINNRNEKKIVEEKEKDLEKTKRLEKVNLE